MRLEKNNRVVMVGPFPPPVCGMSTTNSQVHKTLVALGANVTVLDTAPNALGRSLFSRLSRLPRIIRALGQLMTFHQPRDVAFYASISGGGGQLYEVLLLLIARFLKMRIFVRHCSFAYLEQKRLLPLLLVKAAGPAAQHVTQSWGMTQRLQVLYGAQRAVPISNAVLYGMVAAPIRYRTTVKTVGFLSNLSAEKGVFDFLALMAAIAEQGLSLAGIIAGASQNQRTLERVVDRLESLGNVRYMGAVYGLDKEEFFELIDVFIFPTRYRNETEAKVNLEAMRKGIPVIAYGRGCIPEIVCDKCGLVIDPAEPFVPAALEQLKRWLKDPAAFQAASQAAAARFAKIYRENEGRWKELLAEIIGRP